MFFSQFTQKAPEISESLIHKEKVYRWVYYIEQVCSEVEREMTDTRLDILASILGYIEAFDRYEEILAGSSQLTSGTPNGTC